MAVKVIVPLGHDYNTSCTKVGPSTVKRCESALAAALLEWSQGRDSVIICAPGCEPGRRGFNEETMGSMMEQWFRQRLAVRNISGIQIIANTHDRDVWGTKAEVDWACAWDSEVRTDRSIRDSSLEDVYWLGACYPADIVFVTEHRHSRRVEWIWRSRRGVHDEASFVRLEPDAGRPTLLHEAGAYLLLISPRLRPIVRWIQGVWPQKG